jgi:hypothetical protein
VLTHFRDEQGCLLSEKLAVSGARLADYLKLVVIRDAAEAKGCKDPSRLAFTKPGSRVVFVCGHAFGKVWIGSPTLARAIIIHEVLHTLGLGENGRFPSSSAITHRVLSLCRSDAIQ